MILNSSEYLSSQFYKWEVRGRGWIFSDTPIQLEPPFVPFVRYFAPSQYVDDGKRHTWVSKALEYFKDTSVPEFDKEENGLNYDFIDPFLFERDSDLVGLQIKLPEERIISIENMKALIIMLSYTQFPISYEVIGDADAIHIQFVCHRNDYPILSSNLRSYFPDIVIIENSQCVDNIFLPETCISVIDFGLKEEFIRPLPTIKNLSIDPLTAVFGALENLSGTEYGGIQILFSGVLNPWAESIVQAVTMEDGSSFFADAPESPKLASEKVRSSLFAVTIRVFGQGSTSEESAQVLHHIALPFLIAEQGQSNSLIPLITDEYDIQARLTDISFRQSHRLGMILNADELVSFLHFPGASIQVGKLNHKSRKTREVPSIAIRKDFILGSNIHNGHSHTVTYGIDERLKHTHIIGATGTGKSTLIANLVLQDVEKGIGVTLLDPHGDLIEDVIARLPDRCLDDVVLIDPTDSEYPIGLNILKAHNDIEKEVLSSDLVAAFRRFSTSWGDQMNAVFGNAIIAMLESKEGGTLHDIRRFLIEKDFRNEFLKGVTDPSVLYYWQKEYPLLKTNSIGPILTRLDTFLRPKIIRNMVIQKTGIDFETLINSNKIILVKLAQGLIGTENSYLLGSLILSKIHQASFARQQKTHRSPHFIYIDEFQNFITPSIQQMLSGIRKYYVGLVLSHQDLQQFQREDGELLNSVLGNAYTRIVFRVGENDAKRLQDGFSSFESVDLQNLGRGEAVIRIEQPKFDCSLETILLQEVDFKRRTDKLWHITDHSRKEYGKPKHEIEALLAIDLTDIRQDAQLEDPKPKIKEQSEPKPKEEKRSEALETPVIPEEPKENLTTHRYLQTLIKKMAESHGYVSTIEVQTPDGQGSVDLVISKENSKIAIEVSVSTDAEWEAHNIEKCIQAGYNHVIAVSGDMKQLEKIKQKCILKPVDTSRCNLQFLAPDALFEQLAASNKKETDEPVKIKGYRVNVSYENVSQEEGSRKRSVIANAVLKAIKKKSK